MIPLPITHVLDTLIQERFGQKEDLVEIYGNWNLHPNLDTKICTFTV
jgi:hypothetical protein